MLDDLLPKQPEFKIVINAEGESIESWAPRDNLQNAALSPEEFLGYKIHTGCRGFIDTYVDLSPTHNIWACRKCNLRLSVPKEAINSWEEMKAYFSNLGKVQ